MTNHTKGPWVIAGGLSESSSSIDIRGDGVWICGVNGDHFTPGERPSACATFPGNDEAVVNAILIAAAPDLLEACLYALEALETMENIDRTVLEQAILKARGEA